MGYSHCQVQLTTQDNRYRIFRLDDGWHIATGYGVSVASEVARLERRLKEVGLAEVGFSSYIQASRILLEVIPKLDPKCQILPMHRQAIWLDASGCFEIYSILHHNYKGWYLGNVRAPLQQYRSFLREKSLLKTFTTRDSLVAELQQLCHLVEDVVLVHAQK
jgi:hypothetical protein